MGKKECLGDNFYCLEPPRNLSFIAVTYQDREVCDSFAHDLFAESSSAPVDTLQTASDPATLCNRSCLKQRLSF